MPLWSPCGPVVVQLWSRCGAAVVPLWSISGPAVVHPLLLDCSSCGAPLVFGSGTLVVHLVVVLLLTVGRCISRLGGNSEGRICFPLESLVGGYLEPITAP